MHFDKDEFRKLITKSLIQYRLYSQAATELLMGTCAVESDFGAAMVQKGGGPARGPFQVEAITHQDIWERYIVPRPGLRYAIQEEFGTSVPSKYLLEHDTKYCLLIARFKYRMDQQPLPPAEDITALAAYWKRVYNTNLGKGKTEDFIEKYQRYCV